MQRSVLSSYSTYRTPRNKPCRSPRHKPCRSLICSPCSVSALTAVRRSALPQVRPSDSRLPPQLFRVFNVDMETMVIVLSQLVDFLQVVTDLSEVLAVPWPKAYFMFQSKLEILQFDVFSLPQVSCMAPSQTFYTTFRVFVIGTAALHALVWACFACGWVYTRLLPTSDGRRQLDKLRRVCLARSSFIMSLTLIVVTKSVINMYRCTNLQSAGFFLTRDLRIQCYTPAHTAARRTAALALLAYPVRGGQCPGARARGGMMPPPVFCVDGKPPPRRALQMGVPLAILAALAWFGAPRAAADRVRTAWLLEIVENAWREGLQQPYSGDIRRLSYETISAEHVSFLHAHYVRKGGAAATAGSAAQQAEEAEAGRTSAPRRVDSVAAALALLGKGVAAVKGVAKRVDRILESAATRRLPRVEDGQRRREARVEAVCASVRILLPRACLRCCIACADAQPPRWSPRPTARRPAAMGTAVGRHFYPAAFLGGERGTRGQRRRGW